MTGRFRLLAAAVALPLVAGAGAARAGADGEACLEALRDPEAASIACDVRFTLPAEERGTVRALTAGILRDASCLAAIDMKREDFVRALLREDLLEVPRQPVVCEIATEDAPIAARFTLSPKVWFAGGRAVRATPDMADLTGLPALLAGLVENWVNESDAIEEAMVDAVNDYLDEGAPE